MTNIIEILKGLSIEVPADKISDLNKQVSENYKTNAEYEKKISKLETERDSYKEKADTAEETLKNFEGKDFDAMQKEVESWKSKAEEAEKNFNQKIADREKEDLLKEAFKDIEFTSESAKKAIMSQISTDISVKNGKLIGFNELLEEAKTTDAGAFVNKQQQQLEQNKAKFTQTISNSGGNNGVTKESIMAIKDRQERQKAMLENKALFGLE